LSLNRYSLFDFICLWFDSTNIISFSELRKLFKVKLLTFSEHRWPVFEFC